MEKGKLQGSLDLRLKKSKKWQDKVQAYEDLYLLFCKEQLADFIKFAPQMEGFLRENNQSTFSKQFSSFVKMSNLVSTKR